MRMGWMRVELLIPWSHSLKDKRRPVKSLLEKLRAKFQVAAAEVDAQDLHQRAVLGIGLVAADGGNLAERMRAVREFLHQNPDCQVLDIREESMGWRGE